jgi:hypothetical protein
MSKRHNYRMTEAAVLRTLCDLDLRGIQPEQGPEQERLAIALGERDVLRAKLRELGDIMCDTPSRTLGERIASLEADEGEMDGLIANLRNEVAQRKVVQNPNAHQQSLRSLAQAMMSAEGEALYEIRSSMNAAIREFVDRIEFTNTRVEVTVLQGLVAFAYEPDNRQTTVYDQRGKIDRYGGIPAVAIHANDPVLKEKMASLMSPPQAA